MSHEKRALQKRKFYIPSRYVYLVGRVTDVFTSVFQDGVMPLAITSMVRATTKTADDHSITAANSSMASSDICTGFHEATNSSSSVKGGDFDWSELVQSYVTNGNSYGSVLSMMLAARLIQMWSPKLMAVGAALFSIVATALSPVLAHWSVYALIVVRVLQGAVSGLTLPIAFELDSTWFPPDERQMLCSIIFASVSISSIISSSVIGYLVDTCGWETVFYIIAGMNILSVCVWVFTIYDNPLKHPRISEEEKNYIISAVNKETEVNLPVPWLQIIMSAPVWAFLSVSISSTWITFILSTEQPTYLTKMLYYSTTNAGYVVSAGNAVGIVIQLACGSISMWLRRNSYISKLTSYRIFNAVVTLGTAAAIIGITQSGCNTTAIVTLLMLINGFQSSFIAGSFLNHMDLAINFVPALSGLNGTITSIFGIISPTLAAAIINNNQTLTAWKEVFYISAAVSAIPYIIFFFFGSAEEQPWNKVQNKDARQQDKDEETSPDNVLENSSNVNVDVKEYGT